MKGVQLFEETRTHEPIMLRRSAVAEIVPPLLSHARFSFGPLSLLSRLTKATSRVCCDDSSAGPSVIGRGRTHEVERSGFLEGRDGARPTRF
jgi:hypothetical protein